jgi:hypothetical protein
MAVDYTALNLETVQPLIDEFGKSGILLIAEFTEDLVIVDRDGNPILDRDGNPITSRGTVDIEPWASHLGYDMPHPVSLVQTVFKKSDNNGTLVEKDDVLFLVSTKGVTIDPTLSNRMTVDSVTYQVVRIDPLRPGPVIMLWKVHARK